MLSESDTVKSWVESVSRLLLLTKGTVFTCLFHTLTGEMGNKISVVLK